MRYLLSLAVLVWCTKNACAQTAPKDTAQYVTLDTLTVTAQAGPPAYRSAAPHVWEIQHTRLALSFDWKGKTADVKEWIKLHPYFYATDTLVLDAKTMRIDSVQLVGKKGNTDLKYTYENDLLKIRFDRQYQMADSIELFLKYTATPYARNSKGSEAIKDDKGLYFINTDHLTPNKPAEIWTQGETESNSHWMITIDRPNTRFTIQLSLTVPDSVVTLSNGAMTKQVKDKGGMHTDTWKMDMPIQAYAVMFAIGRFSVIKDHWKNKEVSYYVEPNYAPYARLMFNHTPEMIDYFSQATGVPYPWNKYSQVVVRDYISGAMENTSASLFGEFMNEDAREYADRNSEDVVSHELFHQWFGDYVTAESWSNLTVNESFANYGEQLWRRHKHGATSCDELAYNDLQGYLRASAVNDPQLVRFYYDSREDMFDGITYNKGGAVLRYLNYLAGDDAFSNAMRIYLTRNALHSAEAHNWRLAVEEATGQDWNWFFNEWYYHAGHPEIKVTYNYNDTTQTLGVSVKQTQEDSTMVYQVPLKTAVIYGNEKTITDWNITKRKDSFTYAYKKGVRPVIVPDYAHVLPGSMKENKKPEQWLGQFIYSGDHISKRIALSAAGRVLSDSCSQEVVDRALGDSSVYIRRAALSELKATQSDKYIRRWTGKISAIAAGDSDRQVRAAALGVLGGWKVAEAKEIMLRSVSDSSYLVAGAALDALAKIDKDTAYVIAKRLVHTKPRSMLEIYVWTVIGKKGADEDVRLFEERAPFLTGQQKKFFFSTALNNYLKNVKSDVSFSRAIDVYVSMILTEGMQSYRTTIAGYLFQVAAEQKENMKSDSREDAEAARKRLTIVKAALEKVIASEQDADTKKDFDKKMKEVFE